MKPLEQIESREAVLAFAREEAHRYLARMLPTDRLPTVQIDIVPVEGVTFDGFAVDFAPGKVRIRAAMARGALYGVYAMLEALGCSFLFPRSDLEVVPVLSQMPGDLSPLRCSPILGIRGLCLYALNEDHLQESLQTIDWMAKNRFNLLLASEERPCDAVEGMHDILYGQVSAQLTGQLSKRGILLDMSEHSTDVFFPREELFWRHPEWFSLQDGVRVPYQMCYANEEATDEYARRYAAYAAAHPEIQMLGIWPLDGGGYCTCERCRDPYTIVRAMNKVARAVAAVRPDLIVEHLAYTPESYQVPNFPLEDNMCVLMCAKTDKTARDWARHTAGQQGAFYFEYNTNDHYRWRANPWIQPEYCRAIVNRMARMNYRGIISLFLPLNAWFVGALNAHFLRLAYWNPVFDTDDALSALSRTLFGPCAGQGHAALTFLMRDVQRQELWQRFPHGDLDGYENEFFSGRNRALDTLHRERVHRGVLDALRCLGEMDDACLDARGRLCRACLSAYAHLQDLFHTLVDDYAAESGAPCIDPLLTYLDELAVQLGPVFISSRYARWRLIGRDNVFVDKLYDY